MGYEPFQNEVQAQIQLDKLMLELIENPSKLWRLLYSRVRNAWAVKALTRRTVYPRLKKLYSKLKPNEFRLSAITLLKKIAINSSLGKYLSRILIPIVDKNVDDPSIILYPALENTLLNNAFRDYFVNEIFNKSLKIEPVKEDKETKRIRRKLKTLDDLI